jgi:hypothetical protein
MDVQASSSSLRWIASSVRSSRTSRKPAASTSSLQGEPRATNDIDIVLELPIGRDLFGVGSSQFDEVEFSRASSTLAKRRPGPYDRAMSGPTNLADPSFEPTDEQLQELSRRAFAGVAEANAKILATLRVQIAAARQEALRALKQRGERGEP